MIQVIDNSKKKRPVRESVASGTFHALYFTRERFAVGSSTSTTAQVYEPRIVKTVGVCGGRPRIAGTRLAVWALEAARRCGNSNSEIIEMYPSLKARDLRAAWAYVTSHPQEINRQILENKG